MPYGVAAIAEVGRPDPVMGEVGWAYIIAATGVKPTGGGIQEFLKERLARFKMPTDMIFVDQLPLTPLGKVKKLELYRQIAREFGK